MKATAFLLVIYLSGCALPTHEERTAIWTERCSGYGFKPNTPDFANCLMYQDAQYQARVDAAVSDSLNDAQRSAQAYADSVRTLGPSYRRGY